MSRYFYIIKVSNGVHSSETVHLSEECQVSMAKIMGRSRVKWLVLPGYNIFCLAGILFFTFNRECLPSYYNKIYPLFIDFWQFTYQIVRFPVMYFFIVVAIAVSIVLVTKIIRAFRSVTPYLMFSGFILTLMFLFKALWGFNYNIPHFYAYESELEKIDTSFLFSTFIDYTDKINTGSRYITYETDKSILHQNIIALLDKVHDPFYEFDIHRASPGVIKPVFSGTFLNFNTAGMYFPFTGESLYDKGLHPLQLPPVIVHEWFHASGITDEGQCNFFAWLVCTFYIRDEFVNYTADLDLWFDLSRVVRRINPELHKRETERLTPEVKRHFQEIRDNGQRYSSAFDWIQHRFYNFYLKSQGISEGTLNYGKSLNYALNYLSGERG